MRHRNFYLKVADALAGCQLVELELKRYIATAHSTIRRNLPAHIAYRISDNDCAGDALGQLIIKFEKLSNDDELIENLKKFNKKRNKLAHRAIASCINPDGDLDTPPADFIPKAMDMDEWLSQIRVDANTLSNKIFTAGVLLDFDPMLGTD